MDPEGVLQSKRKNSKNANIAFQCPGHMWHLDGYDKLKPCGIPIIGCIDGFSRKVIWLKVSPKL